MSKSAVLLDITSIQKYIFASNKLKENLGASYLVSDVYEKIISKNSKINDLPIKISINGYEGYIGGGNALFLFEEENGKDKEKAKTFVKEWTKSLLVLAPGITVSSAIGDWNGTFENDRKALFDNLTVNKSKFFSQAITQRHGISAESSSDGYSMDIFRKGSDEEYISAATNAKLEAYEKARTKITEEYKQLLADEFCFTGELNKLGQSRGSQNHIAIVHIDGNSMGDRFKVLDSLDATETLSGELENAVKNSFKVLLERIICDLRDPKKEEYLDIKKENNKKVLPIRPIILGGDDITFVCDGRMGIYYAKIFMEAFRIQPVTYGGELSSCAGIAVTKTNFPFYRGYQLAEELCSNAKSRRREKDNDGSWIDFHIAYGGFSGSLSEIRNHHYNPVSKSLIYRPYKLNDNGEFGLETLLKNVKHLNLKEINGKQKYPKNKLKDLREVLSLDQDAISMFVSEMKARGLEFPDINGKGYNKNLFVTNVTPYFDMLEVLKYYPEYEF